MKIVERITMACLYAVAFAGMAGGAASARTPTPTATPAPGGTPSASVPTATSAPSPEQVARFSGFVWPTRPQGAGRVTANIGNVVCGRESEKVMPPLQGAPQIRAYDLDVVSDQVTPGCGFEGALVTFFVEGEKAAQTAIWHPGVLQHVNLSAGPAFSFFTGIIAFSDRPEGGHLVPLIEGRVCGREYQPFIYEESGYRYFLVVSSSDGQPGCGTEGAEVSFNLVDAQGNVMAVANEKGVWHAWGMDSELSQVLNLTFGPAGVITMPGTGTGDGPQQAAPWGHLALALASLGLTGGIAALALRRQG